MEKTYQYTDSSNQLQTLTINNKDLISDIDEADKNYRISKSIIHAELIHIWNWSLRAYHMGVRDREIRAQLKKWQSNIAFGLIRSFIDVFISTLTEKPVAFAVKWLTEEGTTNAQDILHAFATAADVTWFQGEARIAMNEALKVDVFSFEIGILPSAKTRKYTVIGKNEDGTPNVKEVEYADNVWDFPFAKYVPIFELFPDPANSRPRYVTRRSVVSHKSFMQSFGDLISSTDNELGASTIEELVKCLPINANAADKNSYNNARNIVHRDYNIKFRATDVSQYDANGNFSPESASSINNTEVTAELIEYKYYTTENRIVLMANDYPVYIGINPFGFIPFEIMSASDPQYVLDCEGVPYKLAGLSDTMDSFMNNYIDSARAIATPTFVGLKWAFLDEESLKEGTPWQVLWAETEAGANALRRIEKGTVTDFNILDITIKIASQLTGISEYNLGISARERTATGALATTQSSLKRLSPFLMTFTEICSRIAQKWLILMKDYWTEEKYLSASGQQPWQEARYLSNINLAGVVDISLQIDSMQSAIDEFGYKKLTEVFNQMQGRWLINEDEVARQIFKSQWFDPNRFVPTRAPQISASPDGLPPPELTPSSGNDAVDMGQMIAATTTPQVNLGNGGQWQQ